MQVQVTGNAQYDTVALVTLPNGQSLRVFISCVPEIGDDRYRLRIISTVEGRSVGGTDVVIGQ